ncbi:MAG: ATP-binding cassette domain-containing protein [Bacteroidales bacterium]|nr:ATP-binding cassette domain-containing protein [Bacteroidales bacterium]
MLFTHSLKFQYPSGPPFTFPDLQCKPGDNLLILGESGCGKTTLLHLLSGILTPQSGDLDVDGIKLNQLKDTKRDAFRGKQMGMIFQKHFFMEGLSVFENLKAARKLSGSAADNSHLEQLMEKLGISHLSHKKPYKLSQGEQQRFSIARALANKPSYVLADEPTSSLDDRNCEKFVELIRLPLTRKPVCWIIATHDQRLKKYFSNICEL